MKRILVFALSGILLIASLAACSTTPVQVSTSPNMPLLSASGTGEVYIAPDVAYINVGVHTQADTVSAALADNNTQAQNISDTLTGMGIDKKDIQTTNFTVYPMSNYGPDGTITSTYYSVDNTVYVTVRDLNKLGELLDAVVASGANTINGINFDILDKDAAVAQARDLAIQNAKAEAAAIAKSADITLGNLQSISISTNSYPTPVYYGKGGAAYETAASVPVSAGQLSITVSAYLTYEIK